MTVAAVIGLGTMGAGIAATVARAGIETRAFDINPQAAVRSRAQLPAIRKVLDDLEVPDRGDATDVAFCDSLQSAVDGADLVIENIQEDLDEKLKVLAEIDSLVAGHRVIASDTSGIPITTLQAGVSSPERLVGMHWSNPPHIIPIIEVIAGGQTSPETVAWMDRLIRDLNAMPVVVKKDIPGFVENRILYAIMREAIDLVEDGVISPADLDTCVSLGIGYKLSVIGPMSLLDMAGLDIYRSVASYLNTELSNRKDVSAYITDRTGSGKLGIKSGEGIYSYAPDGLDDVRSLRAERFVAVRKALGI